MSSPVCRTDLNRPGFFEFKDSNLIAIFTSFNPGRGDFIPSATKKIFFCW